MKQLPQNNKPMLSLLSFSLRRFHAKTEDMTHNRYLHNATQPSELTFQRVVL